MNFEIDSSFQVARKYILSIFINLLSFIKKLVNLNKFLGVIKFLNVVAESLSRNHS